MYVAFQAKEDPKTRMYIPLEVRKRVCILYFESPGSKYTNVFFQNTENYRKMNKILRNFCTLKTELWVRSQTARCYNFCPPCFESYIYIYIATPAEDMATPAENTLAGEIEADRCRAGQAEKRGEIAAIGKPHGKKRKNNIFPQNEKKKN